MFHFFEKVNKGQVMMVNVTQKNGQILLHYHFNKTIKQPKTSFRLQHRVQKNAGNVCHIAH